MGTYLNPGNSGFTGIRNDIYVDKSGLISLINETIETPRRLTCVSRPRRFGKSFAAQIEKIHAEEAPLHYNNEQALRNVIKRAYFSYGDEYVLFEELPTGKRKHSCVIERVSFCK